MTAPLPPPLVVCHSVPGPWLPLTQTWLHTQVRHLDPAIESHVACDGVENERRFAMSGVHTLADGPAAGRLLDRSMRRLRLRRECGPLVRAARRHGAALVHSHFGPTGWCNLGAVSRLRCRHVVSFYGYDASSMARSDRWRRRYLELFHEVDAVLCEGPHMAARLETLGCPPQRLLVHHLGVETGRIPWQPRRWDGRGPCRFLLAAAFRQKKGLPVALAALGRLARTVDLEITIIGDATAAPSSQREKSRILAAIAEHDLAGRVRLVGFREHDELLAEAARHHVFVSPSVTAEDGDDEGGAPVAIIEMAASGMPVVSTRHCDIPEVIEDGRGGLLAPEGDVDGLLDRLETLLADPGRWEEMTRRARARIERHFDAAIQGRRLGEIYASLTCERPLTGERPLTDERPFACERPFMGERPRRAA